MKSTNPFNLVAVANAAKRAKPIKAKHAFFFSKINIRH